MPQKHSYEYVKNKAQSNKYLYVGDPHVQVKNLKESKKLLRFIISEIEKKQVHTVVFTGDLFHTHAVIRMEVLNFWNQSFKDIQKKSDLIVLCGNHDMILGNSEYSGLNSLSVFKYNVSIVDTPYIYKNIGYLPYIDDKEEFLRAAKELYKQGATECLVAHQTFTGAQYENGFYAPDGIDPELVPQKQIISGHIHKCQDVGKCFYVGTPKWDSMSDANENKGIWIFDHNEDGSVKSKKFISTKEVVTPITKITINEGEEIPDLDPNSRNYVELLGSSAWIKQVKKDLKGQAQIKARPSDRKMVKLDRNKSTNILDFLKEEFKEIEGVGKKDIVNYLSEVGIQ